MVTYELCFQGVWDTEATDHIPEYQGIYGVHIGSPPTSLVVDTPSIDKLIYIGMAENIKTRVFAPSHHKWDDWHRRLGHNQQIYFTTAPFAPFWSESDRNRVEAAMIFHHQPVCNDNGKDSFGYDTTAVNTSGLNFNMSSQFQVIPT